MDTKRTDEIEKRIDALNRDKKELLMAHVFGWCIGRFWNTDSDDANAFFERVEDRLDVLEKIGGEDE